MSRGSGDTAGVWPAATPVAHVSLLPDEQHIVRRHADIPHSQHLPRRRIQLTEPVRQVESDVKALAIARDAQARRNLGLTIERVGGWQRQRAQAGDGAGFIDPENLDAAIDIGQVNLRSIGRKDQAGEAELPLFIRLQDMFRDRTGGGFFPGFRRQRHPLQNAAGLGRYHDQLGGFAGGHQNFSVGTKRQGLRSKTGQHDLDPHRSQNLVDGSNSSSGLQTGDGFSGTRSI